MREVAPQTTFERMTFKYQKETETIPNCPPENSAGGEIICFRYVHSDLNHENNFLPAFIINPTRRNDSFDAQVCSGYGLSFFNSFDGAVRKYKALAKSFKQINLKLGTHVARGTLSETDGVRTAPNEIGHFDLHEFVNVNLKSRFVIIEKVYNGDA